MKAHRGNVTHTMMEHSPAYVSKANGSIERALQNVEGQTRTLKTALESRTSTKTRLDGCILPRRSDHAGLFGLTPQMTRINASACVGLSYINAS